MKSRVLFLGVSALLMAVIFSLMKPACSSAADKAILERDAVTALQNLYDTAPGAKTLGQTAKAVLVFPKILKAGFIFGGQYGDGALLKGTTADSFYRSFAASWGLQAGAQAFSYALFFMTDEDLGYLNRSYGWELGVGPTIVVMDMGAAASMSTTTAKKGIYAFIFDQKGLMAGVSIEGAKITKIKVK